MNITIYIGAIGGGEKLVLTLARAGCGCHSYGGCKSGRWGFDDARIKSLRGMVSSMLLLRSVDMPRKIY